MKSIFIGSMLVCLCVQSSIAQHIASAPQHIQNIFKKAYPGAAKVKWEKEQSNYEASFQYNNHAISVLYATDGGVLETETTIPVSELPKAAQKYASDNGHIKDAARIVKADGSVQYEAEVKGSDLLFTDKGSFISETKEKD